MEKANANKPLDKRICTIDKAKELSGIGKYHYVILAVTGFASLSVAIESTSMAMALPMSKCDLDISPSEQGFINSIVFIGVLLSSHFWGFITDTWGRVRTLRCTLLLAFFSSALSSMSTETWMLILTRLLVGLTSSGAKISAYAYLGEFFDNKSRTKYLTLMVSISVLSAILSPLLGMAILTQNFEYNWFSGFVYRPWRLFTFVTSLIAGLTAVVTFFLPEGPSFSMAIGRQQDALKTLTTMYRVNTGRPRKEYGVIEITTDENASSLNSVKNFKQALRLVWNQTWPIFSSKYRMNMIILCVLMFSGLGFAQALSMWYPQILLLFEGNESLAITTCQTIEIATESKSFLIDPIINTTLLSKQSECNLSFNMSTINVIMMRGVVGVALTFGVAFTISFIGKTTVITTWYTLCTIGAFALFWTNNYYANMAMMIMYMSAQNLGNCYIAISSDLFETKYKGMVISLLNMSSRAGTIVASNILGAYLYTACGSMFIMMAVLMLFCACAAYYLLRKADKVAA